MSSRALYFLAAVIFFLGLTVFYILAPADSSPALLTKGEGRRLTLLDSAFWTSGSSAEPDFSRLVEETNPLTQEPYTEEQIQRISQLWRLFPENSLLPRPARDRFRREKEAEEMDDIAKSIGAGDASDAEVMRFYGARIREAQDRIQLVQHVLTEQWPAEVMDRYARMLNNDRDLVKRIESERVAALDLIKDRKTQGSVR